MSGSIISIDDFNKSKAEAINLTDDEQFDQELDEAIDIAEEIVESIVGFCPECNERHNSFLTVQHVMVRLAESLHNDADVTREEFHDMLDALVFDPHGEES